MVRAADLGYISKNLERVPSGEDMKKSKHERAVLNLTSPERPSRLVKNPLPNRLIADLAKALNQGNLGG